MVPQEHTSEYHTYGLQKVPRRFRSRTRLNAMRLARDSCGSAMVHQTFNKSSPELPQRLYELNIAQPTFQSKYLVLGPGTEKFGFYMRFGVESTHGCPKRMERCRKWAQQRNNTMLYGKSIVSKSIPAQALHKPLHT